MGADAMRWLAAHLSWVIWALLVIWTPPVAYTIAIDLGLVAAPGSGYAALSDPSLLIATLQIALMAAALPGVAARRAGGWAWLAAAWAAWLVHAAWSIASRVRVSGPRTLSATETVVPLAGLLAAAAVLLGVRAHFGGERAHDSHGHDAPPVAPGGPAHVP
jgi:hypothetical protein